VTRDPCRVEPFIEHQGELRGIWLHQHRSSIGIDNEVIDAASIEFSRRLAGFQAGC